MLHHYFHTVIRPLASSWSDHMRKHAVGSFYIEIIIEDVEVTEFFIL